MYLEEKSASIANVNLFHHLIRPSTIPQRPQVLEVQRRLCVADFRQYLGKINSDIVFRMTLADHANTQFETYFNEADLKRILM